MRAELGLPSVRGDDDKGGGMMGGFGGSMGGVGAGKAKRPIQVKFEIPYFTTSGIQVRYLKIIEPKVCSDRSVPCTSAPLHIKGTRDGRSGTMRSAYMPDDPNEWPIQVALMRSGSEHAHIEPVPGEESNWLTCSIVAVPFASLGSVYYPVRRHCCPLA
jgi:hypothetical protein